MRMNASSPKPNAKRLTAGQLSRNGRARAGSAPVDVARAAVRWVAGTQQGPRATARAARDAGVARLRDAGLVLEAILGFAQKLRSGAGACFPFALGSRPSARRREGGT